MARLRLHVDRDRCQGHNRCYALTPELVEVDDHGYSKEIGDGTVAPALESKARLCVANCPEHAVSLTES